MSVYFLNKKKTYTLSILAFFIVVFFVNFNTPLNQNSFLLQIHGLGDFEIPKDMNYYENTELGVRLFYPTDWETKSIKNGVQFIKMANILVEIRLNNLEGNSNLEQYFQEYIEDKREKRKDFNLLSSQSYLLNGTVPAYNAIYTFTIDDEKDELYNGQTLKVYRILTMHGDKIYNIAYTANLNDFVQFFEIAQNTIISIKIFDDNE